MLEVASLECVRGDLSLFNDLTFSVNAGELMHLHGHNGSGKTTLLRTLSGLVKPVHGEVLWLGENIDELQEDFTRHLTYIGHKNAIKDDLSAVENLQIASLLDGFAVSDDQAWQALDQIGLRGMEDLPTKVLSQGQKKRVALARLLVTQTRLWILDEPFVALDKQAVVLLEQVIRDHIANGGLAIVTTHQEVSLTRGKVKELKLGWK
jgi:heme exporter protein A